MEPNNMQDQYREQWEAWQQRSRYGRVMGGLLLVIIGGVLLARQMGVVLPVWLFTWEMLLIVIGVYTGAKHGFQTRGWMIPVLIGVLFLLDDFYPEFNVGPLLWPVVIISAGVLMILTPRRHKGKFRNWEKWMKRKEYCSSETSTSDDHFESTSIFGGVKKHIISKNFKEGEVTCFMGGAEINFSQADFTGKATLEVTQVFGGTNIVVPPHWEIQTDMTAVFGGVEDKRPVYKEPVTAENKVLLIKGTSVFGGIEINSY